MTAPARAIGDLDAAVTAAEDSVLAAMGHGTAERDQFEAAASNFSRTKAALFETVQDVQAAQEKATEGLALDFPQSGSVLLDRLNTQADVEAEKKGVANIPAATLAVLETNDLDQATRAQLAAELQALKANIKIYQDANVTFRQALVTLDAHDAAAVSTYIQDLTNIDLATS